MILWTFLQPSISQNMLFPKEEAEIKAKEIILSHLIKLKKQILRLINWLQDGIPVPKGL